jgi:hypothetical protein
VVTADGRWRHVDAASDPDLFWALRGGGGRYGVVTHFEFSLHPLGPIVYGGTLGWPLAQTKEVIGALREEITNAPDELALQFLLTIAPDVEFLPEALRGKPALMLSATWLTNDLDEGERRLAPFRERVTPTLDMLGRVPYTFLQAASDPLVPHGRRSFAQTRFLPDLSDEFLDAALARCDLFPSQHCLVELFHLEGAVAQVPEDQAAAAGFRDAAWYCTVAANAPDEGQDEICRQWVIDTDTAMDPFRLPGRYINFLLDDHEEALAEAYGEDKWQRLQEIKAKYDPDGVFAHNPNYLDDAVPAGA